MNVSVGGTLNHNTNQSYLLPVSSNTLFFFSGVLDYYSLLEIQELLDALGEFIQNVIRLIEKRNGPLLDNFKTLL